MGFDPASFAIGKASGGGGGGGGETPLRMERIAGYIGTRELASYNTLDFTINNSSGKYAAILCWTRGPVNPPTGASVLYQKRRDMGSFEVVLTFIKAPITSDSFTVSIGNPNVVRSGGVCFVMSKDFTANVVTELNNTTAEVTWSAGFSVFVSLCGYTFNGVGRNPGVSTPAVYLWPTDETSTSGGSLRALAGYINATEGGTAFLGSISSDSNGIFACLHLDEVP